MLREEPLRVIPKGTFDIVCPEIKLNREDASSTRIRVTKKSRKALRNAVATLARSLAKECDYSGLGLFDSDGNDDGDRYVAYLYPAEYGDWEGWKMPMVGAVCFRWRQYAGRSEPLCSLAWIYMHPFFRNGKILTAFEWQRLCEEFGDFPVEEPISRSMKRFLEKQGWTCPIDSGRILFNETSD